MHRHPGVIAAVLVLIAAVIGLVATFLDASGGKETIVVSAPGEPSTGSTGGGETETAPKRGDRTSETVQPETQDPVPATPIPRDGSSPAHAKPLIANKSTDASLDAGNDVDWWVYRAAESQTALVEVTKGEGNEEYGSVLVTVIEGSQQVADERVIAEEPPPTIRRSLSSGQRLFVKVIDDCGDVNPCGIGPYSIVVRAGAAG